jgi:hypothetical protein
MCINKTIPIETFLKNDTCVPLELTLEVRDNDTLKFPDYIDVVDSFFCLTFNSKFDILIDDVIHYQNIDTFILVVNAMDKSVIKIKTLKPIILSCRGYMFPPHIKTGLQMNTIKTSTTKYKNGFAVRRTRLK